MDRTVVISIDGDVLEFELEQPDDVSEDDFFLIVCDYVMDNIKIDRCYVYYNAFNGKVRRVSNERRIYYRNLVILGRIFQTYK